VAWTRPRVDSCYQCLPGGPFTPPPCQGCGSLNYFSAGLCEGCHPGGPLHPGTCEGCLAWGVYRAYLWRCWYCKWWRTHYPEGDCRYCGRRTTVSETRTCRLCWEQGRLVQEPGRAADVAAATRHGQQLFFANMHGRRPRRDRLPAAGAAIDSRGRKRPLPRLRKVAAGQVFEPIPWQQLPLFEVDLDPAQLKIEAATIDNALLRYCDEVVRDHAAGHGWTTKLTNDVRRSLRLIQVRQHTPGAKIAATDVFKALQGTANVNAESTLEVLAAAGLLIDDRPSPVQQYFDTKFACLPAPMTAQLRLWFEVMLEGSTKTPRRLPRDPATARLHIRGVAPIMRIWAAQGHDSLAEIDRDDIVAVLPPPGPARYYADQGLRSLFKVLKANKVVFVNPTRSVPATPTNSTIPVPIDTQAIHDALNAPDPATALAVALVAFHALPSRQVRALQLTDICDGRLNTAGRVIPLAEPVLPRLRAWLDYRARTWPATANPHLFINRRTGPRLMPVSRTFPWKHVTFSAQSLREDRILDEVRATGGDVKRICELFDLSVEGTARYTAILDHTDSHPDEGPATI